MLKIIEKTKLWFAISLTVIIIGLGFMAFKGLEFGIDFKGGTLVRIDMGKDFDKTQVDTIIKKYTTDFQSNKATNPDTNSVELEIKSNSVTSEKISSIFKDLKDKYKLKDTALISSDTIGATIGNELKQKAVTAILLASVAILIYIGVRFEFNFAVAAIIALLHDVLITLAVYSVFRIQVNSGFIAAMLTVIGYSINDTIVVFDRIRENSKYMRRTDVVELANASVTQTMARSINTVMTVLITLVAVYIFVPAVRDFSFPLIIGVVSGCYSSIFIASPLWVIFKKRNKKTRTSAA